MPSSKRLRTGAGQLAPASLLQGTRCQGCDSCSWWLLRLLSLGMAEMRGVLLVLLYVSHTSASCGIQKVFDLDSSEDNPVSSMEFPWVVSLQDSQYTHLAFGCILSEFWILSIASAFQNRKDIVVIVGIANMNPTRITHTEYPVSTIIIHEDFDNKSMGNNIALLKTDTAIYFNDLVQSICFLGRKLQMPPALWNCWVSGWNPTSATGNHMTMSVLRKMSVKDISLCPLRKLWKTGCGSHTKEETKSICLGDPGSPMMCQLQQMDLWVLKGILTVGGEDCPGIFLYTKVDDYSNWIMSKTESAGLPVSSLHHWERLISFPRHPSYAVTTRKTQPGRSHIGWSPSYFQGQRRSTVHSWITNSSRDGLDFREKDLRESGKSSEMSIQPMYYDYYGGEVEGGRSMAGQNRLHQSQEIILVFFVLVFFCSSV
ncbi:inactive serine protease 54 isoform X2 [Tupaia chinensis]|uniref:inactive serine protease 54 isoform X2 n=1 Tax=Tupaia chinensis TaxID=246437 RepID=UPI000704741B|nr:inactive serine protease 54 isoform X2 [Tupaia chinensis]